MCIRDRVNSIKDKLNIPHDLGVSMIDMNLCMNLLFDHLPDNELLDNMKINYDNTFYVDVRTKTSDQIKMFNKILILKKGYSLRTSCDYYVDHNLTIKFRTMQALADIKKFLLEFCDKNIIEKNTLDKYEVIEFEELLESLIHIYSSNGDNQILVTLLFVKSLLRIH